MRVKREGSRWNQSLSDWLSGELMEDAKECERAERAMDGLCRLVDALANKGILSDTDIQAIAGIYSCYRPPVLTQDVEG